MRQQILIASDGELNQPVYNVLKEHRFQIAIESDAERAYERLVASPGDLLLIDISALRVAVDLVKKVRSTPGLRNTSVLVVAEWGTGQPTLALSAGADAFEPKPISAHRLVEAVEELLRPRMAMTAKASTTDGESAE